MIERQTIDGREATIAYLDSTFQPTEKTDSALVKIIFDDGGVLFLGPGAPAKETPTEPLTVDLLEIDLAEGHWLAKPPMDREAIRARVRAKHRAAHLAKPIERKPVQPETMARLQAAYEAAKADDPALEEARGFARHRARQAAPITLPPPDEADVEGELEAAGFSRHRARHAAVFVTVETEPTLPEEVIAEPETVADIPVKLQLVAWAKAIMVLDASEVLVRDLIERELAGKTGDFAAYQPLRVLAITRRLCAQIKDVREEAIKTAFRLLRARLGNVPVLTVSLPTWAAYFAQQDYKAIEAAIQLGLADGLDNTEIARKVVGSMGLNGVDGVTEFIRHKIAHLGRASIRASQYAKQGEPGLT